MSGGPSWYSWLSFPFFAPLSGSVAQEIAAQPYQGVPEIEAAVIREAGSFGRQLGILSDAVLELAARIDPDRAKTDSHALREAVGAAPVSALDKLRELAAEVDAIKSRHGAAAEREAERALDRLRALDPQAHDRLAARFRG